MKKQTGITLIALVITIIVLLILAGVSISAITGENGIVNKAKEAKEKTEQAEEEELETLKQMEDWIDSETSDLEPELTFPYGTLYTGIYNGQKLGGIIYENGVLEGLYIDGSKFVSAEIMECVIDGNSIKVDSSDFGTISNNYNTITIAGIVFNKTTTQLIYCTEHNWEQVEGDEKYHKCVTCGRSGFHDDGDGLCYICDYFLYCMHYEEDLIYTYVDEEYCNATCGSCGEEMGKESHNEADNPYYWIEYVDFTDNGDGTHTLVETCCHGGEIYRITQPHDELENPDDKYGEIFTSADHDVVDNEDGTHTFYYECGGCPAIFEGETEVHCDDDWNPIESGTCSQCGATVTAE